MYCGTYFSLGQHSMTLFIFLSLIALGIGSGFLAGLLGIGGGMIITPFLSVLLTMQGVPAARSDRYIAFHHSFYLDVVCPGP